MNKVYKDTLISVKVFRNLTQFAVNTIETRKYVLRCIGYVEEVVLSIYKKE